MINKIGIYTAIISFVLGSIFFLSFFYTDYRYQLMIPGMFFVIIAAIVNAGILLGLINKFIKEKENRNKNLISAGIILLNIPIAIIYFHFVMIEYMKNTVAF
ncbi:hypothetical protein ACFQ5N_08470 [Lutibacter holmesii]|uniref:Branched-chain amino acid:cation transporter, LIVCS family n=2 Tax=Lutibacter TaxID=358023 RepID=A0A238XN08_9FLAO|nr:hypothetical protein [Lutibacter agarilyticus]SNR60365.1 hypothetical protein SAMN06265371_106191 [Lutibacter agarilyticus]